MAREKDRLREPVQDMAQVIGRPVVFMLINFPPFHLKAAVAGILRVAVAKDENRLFRILFLRELHLAVQPDEVAEPAIWRKVRKSFCSFSSSSLDPSLDGSRRGRRSAEEFFLHQRDSNAFFSFFYK